MKIAIIGASGHGVYVLDGLRERPDCKLVGIAPGSAGETLAQLDEPLVRASIEAPRFDDAMRMLDETEPDVVAVNPFIQDIERYALEIMDRGIHAFVEKPLSMELGGVARLRAAHAASGVEFASMLNMRYDAGFRAACVALEDGAVGDVRVVHAQKSYRLGVRPDFFKLRATFGGMLPWIGSHAFDIIAFTSGKRFERLSAMHSTMHNRDHGELEVSAACLVELEGGASATVNLDYFRPAAAPSHGDDRVRVVGSDGILEVREGRAFLMDGAGSRELAAPEHRVFFADFVDQVAGQGTCLVSAEESFRNTELALLARKAADSGCPVDVRA